MSVCLLVLLVQVLNCNAQSSQQIYSFDFTTTTGWAVSSGSAFVPWSGIWGDGVCDVSCWNSWYAATGYKTFSTVGYHTIRVIIDIAQTMTGSSEYCDVEYTSGAYGEWQTLLHFPGNNGLQYRHGLELQLPDASTINNRADFQLQMHSLSFGGECGFGILQIWGIPYTDPPTESPTPNTPSPTANTISPTSNTPSPLTPSPTAITVPPTSATLNPSTSPTPPTSPPTPATNAPTSTTNSPTADTTSPTLSTLNPSASPSVAPTKRPTNNPSSATRNPTESPTNDPTENAGGVDSDDDRDNTESTVFEEQNNISKQNENSISLGIILVILGCVFALGFCCVLLCIIRRRKQVTNNFVKDENKVDRLYSMSQTGTKPDNVNKAAIQEEEGGMEMTGVVRDDLDDDNVDVDVEFGITKGGDDTGSNELEYNNHVDTDSDVIDDLDKYVTAGGNGTNESDEFEVFDNNDDTPTSNQPNDNDIDIINDINTHTTPMGPELSNNNNDNNVELMSGNDEDIDIIQDIDNIHQTPMGAVDMDEDQIMINDDDDDMVEEMVTIM